MRIRRRIAAIAAVLTLSGCAADPAPQPVTVDPAATQAQPQPPQPPPPPPPPAASPAPQPAQSNITREQAEATALNAVGGGRVFDADFDIDDGLMIWEIEVLSDDLRTEHEVFLDATSGAVLAVERDDRDD